MIQPNQYYPNQGNYNNNQKQTQEAPYQNSKYNQQKNPNYSVQTINPKHALINKNYILPQNQAFSGQSNYVNSYKNNSDSRVKTQRITYQKNQVFPQGKFEGNTSYLNDYINGTGTRSQVMRHEGNLKIGGKFEGLSNYNQNYLNNQNIPRQQKIVHPSNQIMPDGQYEKLSTYNGNYQGNPVEKRAIIKHEGSLKVNGGQFVGQSTYGGDYIPGQFEKNQIKRHEGNLKIGGKFEGLSNYNQNYLNNQNIPRQQKIVHPSNQIMPDGQYEKLSTYNGNYQGNPVEKRAIIKHEGSLKVNGGQFVGQSTYGGDYIQGQFERNMQIKPQGQLKIGGQFSGTSNYNQNYQNKGIIQKAQKYVLPQNKMFPQGRFEDNTTYNGNYIENQIQKIQQIKPESQLKVAGGKFDSLSNYNQDFMGKSAQQKRQKMVYKPNEILPKGNFQGNSNYQQTYIQTQALNRSKPYKIQGQLKVGGQFYGQSSYHQNYYNKGAPTKNQKIIYAPNYVMPSGVFQNSTNYADNYQQNPVQRNIAIKPEGQLKIGNQQFQGTSKYNSDYVAFQAQKRRQKCVLPQNIVMPKGNFDGHSTYVDAYVPSAIEKNSQIKPGNNLEVGGKFQGNSSYTQNYDRSYDYPRYLSKQNEYNISKK